MTRRTWRSFSVLALIAAAVTAAVLVAAAAAPYTVRITLKEFAFVPKVVTVPAGSVRLVLTNAGTVEHTLVIPALKVKTPPIKPGQTFTVAVAVTKGSYQGYCDIPGHKELGMVLTLVVK